MTQDAEPQTNRVNWPRLVVSGLVAGVIVNAFEYGGDRVVFNDEWTAAFRALGKEPAGWSTFIPAGFGVGFFTMWLYWRLRPRYGKGPMTAMRAALAIWVVFWAIPLLSLVPMDLFPSHLVFIAIALGLVDVPLAALVGAWLYKDG